MEGTIIGDEPVSITPDSPSSIRTNYLNLVQYSTDCGLDLPNWTTLEELNPMLGRSIAIS
jgi:hypothetical protein